MIKYRLIKINCFSVKNDIYHSLVLSSGWVESCSCSWLLLNWHHTWLCHHHWLPHHWLSHHWLSHRDWLQEFLIRLHHHLLLLHHHLLLHWVHHHLWLSNHTLSLHRISHNWLRHCRHGSNNVLRKRSLYVGGDHIVFLRG